MRRADRLFDIIQLLRGARHPVTASGMADALEVSPRTVYRDIVALQGSGVPIEGASGLGYMLRPGYDLPPLMFRTDRIRAVDALDIHYPVDRPDLLAGVARAA